MTPYAVGVAGAIIGSIVGSTTASTTAGIIAANTLDGIAVGAGAGGLNDAFTGGDILQGMAYGAAIGGATAFASELIIEGVKAMQEFAAGSSITATCPGWQKAYIAGGDRQIELEALKRTQAFCMKKNIMRQDGLTIC